MGTFIFILLLIVIAIFFFGVSFISGIVRLFSKGPNVSGRRYSSNHTNRNYSGNEHTQTSNDNQKVFSKDEGEYVDFEEIK